MYKIIASFTHWGGRKALLIQGKTKNSIESFKARDYFLALYKEHRKNYTPTKFAITNGNWDILFIINKEIK